MPRSIPWCPARCLLLLLSGLSTATPLHAAEPAPVIQEYQRLEQQRIDEEARRRLQEAPQRLQPEVAMETPIALLPEGQCQTIRKIWLYGADVLDSSDRESLLAPYRGKCLDNAAINALARDIQKWYLDAGYITSRTRLKVPQDSLDKGNLEIWVFEGRIGEIRTENDTAFDRRRIRAAFPVGPNDVLNIHDLDQGLEQLNRLFSQRFRMQIRPSERPGFSDVILFEVTADTGRYRNRRQARYTLNDSGVEATGRLLQQLEYRQDNLVGYNDSLLLAWQRNTDFDATARANESYRIDASFPWGYGFYRLNGYLGKTARLIPGTNVAFYSRSEIGNLRLSANRVLRRSASSKTEATLALDYSQRKSFINDTQIEVSSRNTTGVELGLVETRYFPGSTLILAPGLVRGVPWFGTLRDPADLTDDAPHAEYTLAKLYLYYQRAFHPRHHSPITWQAAFTGQASTVPLYGEKQIVVGGEYSVRGFRDNVASGDNGWYLRNDLVLPLQAWFRTTFTVPLNLRLFADTGVAIDKSSGSRYQLSGWGFGLDFSRRWLEGRIQVATPIAASNGFTYRDDWTIYASISARWIF